jgi:ribosomal protein S18 acetylase RimI-like enzyme
VPETIIRPLAPTDSLIDLTDLLHTAHLRLVEQGFRFTASHQSPEVTAERVANGECFVACLGEELAGTICVAPPGRTQYHPYYRQPGVAKLGQLAVLPRYQGRGIARRLLDTAERRAMAMGASTIAFDTAESAVELIATYQRRGYQIVDRADWRPHVNYKSVIFARSVASFAL